MSWDREIRTLVRRMIRGEMTSVRTALPAQVEAYDSEARTVSVRPCVRAVRSESPDATTVDLPLLADVPILTYGSGTLLLALPVAVGSYGLVVFCDRDISGWLVGGGVADPTSIRQHDLSDAIFMPGLYPYAVDGDNGHIEVPVEDGRISLRTRDGKTCVSVADDGTILAANDSATLTIDPDGNVGVTAAGDVLLSADGTITTSGSETVLQDGTDFAVQYTALKSAFDTLKTDFNNFVIWATAHVHPGVLAGAASTAVAVPPPVQTTADMTGAKIADVRLP